MFAGFLTVWTVTSWLSNLDLFIYISYNYAYTGPEDEWSGQEVGVVMGVARM